eukprot:TRINITY_DN4750_c0_g2_i1.p1 TRINITY_DN4750_c0_g2~~TRINITY_DN4750_c0_g2_i1.p1  ORF type:complete len:634 (-),score=91.76 TRINITY_DN4750_c0_g2_i1:155-2056(-)
MPPFPSFVPTGFPKALSSNDTEWQVHCDDVDIVIEDGLATQPHSGTSNYTTAEEHDDRLLVMNKGIHMQKEVGTIDDVSVVQLSLQRFEKILVDNMATLTEAVASLDLLSTSVTRPAAKEISPARKSYAASKWNTSSKSAIGPMSSSSTFGFKLSEAVPIESEVSILPVNKTISNSFGKIRRKAIGSVHEFADRRRRNVSISGSIVMDHAVATDILGYLPDTIREHNVGRVVSFSRRIKDSPLFTTFVMIALLVSTVTYGIQVDNFVIRGSIDPLLESIETTCTLILTFELLLRLTSTPANRLLGRFDGSLVFDGCIVISAWIDFVIRLVVAERRLSSDINSILIIVRSLRSLRICRLVFFLPQVRVVLMTILSSMNALFWLLVVMLCVMFVFAVILTEGAGQLLQHGEVPHELIEDMTRDFGSVVRSVYTLFQSAVGGIEWGGPAGLTLHFGLGYFAVFLSYISLMMFSVLNVVLGFFVDGAIQLMERDREICRVRLIEQNRNIADDLVTLLKGLDTDGDGEITYGEWLHALADSKIRLLLGVLGFDTVDVKQLFDLLDADDSGTISLRELVRGMQRVRGKVTALHVDLVLKQTDRLITMENLLASLDSQLKTLIPASTIQQHQDSGRPIEQ